MRLSLKQQRMPPLRRPVMTSDSEVNRAASGTEAWLRKPLPDVSLLPIKFLPDSRIVIAFGSAWL
jgi:hypothetical protein